VKSNRCFGGKSDGSKSDPCKKLSLLPASCFFYWWGGTKSLGTAGTSGLLYKLQMIDEDDCGAIGGMKIGRGNRSIRRKPAPAPLCSQLHVSLLSGFIFDPQDGRDMFFRNVR
jgi:hypothetical protein